ncbi:hypothetical protein U27_00564 [Candidatus Vecturithrix granuli]|uniref:Glycosyltransferase subfamily 4-like N-terminal domain-containing protein n=1 Tax=Vecturithrix granuli TaxID=1499967 RepID=A0A081C7W2_VECG1|nr:hypothetical protein U27_00564 [Candidatus Vecturithrix granuli]
MKRQRILILSFTQIYRTPRVYRQIVFLKDLYELVVAGFGVFEAEGVEFHQLTEVRPRHIADRFLRKGLRILRLTSRQFEQYYWSIPEVREVLATFKGSQYDVIIAHDLHTLPVALALAANNGAKVLLDAHEYEPRHFDNSWRFRMLYQPYWDYICRRYLPRVDAMITVCQGIADEYARVYGVACDVLTNAPFYEDLSPGPTDAECIRLIHHGGLHPSRKLENMIFLMDRLDERFHLDLMLLLNSPRYARYLQQLKELASRRPRIQFCEPVPMPEIARSINQYDLGIYLMSPTNFNNRMALPNKLFEFIQARLAVAIWPSTEMARIVREHGCGVIAADFTIEAIAEKLNSLSVQEIERYKLGSHQAARILSAENNCRILRGIIADLIGA